MTTHHLRLSIYLLLLGGFSLQACQAQVETNSIVTTPSQLSPKIVGPLPPPDRDPGVVSQYIRCIFQDSRGHYWFGPASQSVARYDGHTLTYVSKAAFFQGNDQITSEYGNSVHAIAEDQQGNIWFGTDHGIVTYDGERFRSYTQKHGLLDPRVGRKSILVDRSGTLWVGTQGGVFRYAPTADSSGGQCFQRFNLLPPIHVRDLMEDQAGNIWVASQAKGVFWYDGQAVHHLTAPEGIGDNYAGGMAQDSAGNYWFTMKGGICRYDGHTFTKITTEDGIGGSAIWGIWVEASGIIWITARGSTTRFDPSLPTSDSNAFQVYRPEDGLNCCVQSMYQDRAGRMWWGTGQGLYRFDGQHFYQVKQTGPW